MIRDPLALALAVVGVTLGCGTPGPAAPASSATPVTTAPSAAEAERAERARRSELAAAHRVRLDEQATALAATCAQPAAAAAKRCVPSCYPAEAADPRAGKPAGRAAVITHLVCTRAQPPAGRFLIADELGGAALEIRGLRGRVPKRHPKGTWQAAVEAEVHAALGPEIARGDVVRVIGNWRARTHPVTQERLRCVPVAHYARSVRRALDRCGSLGAIACEATGNAAALGLNLVHYRLVEARRLQAAGDDPACRQAALEAVAVARGLPRWRQYMTLNTDRWQAVPRYRTRFDGVLDEDTLFAIAIELGTAAQAVYVACGGEANPTSTAAQEQSFHSCP